MNKVFKNVWNSSLGVWVAVSETCKGQKKGSNKVKKGLAVAAILSVVSGAAFAQTGTTGGEQQGTERTGTAISSCGATNGVDEAGEAFAANYGVAIGCSADATEQAVAIGYGAKADTSAWSVAIGADSHAAGAEAVAIGKSALAERAFNTAVGGVAEAKGTTSVALGYAAKAGDTYTVHTLAVGTDTEAKYSHATAVGSSANAGADRATAIGSHASATHEDSIALGAGAVTEAPNTSREVETFTVNRVEKSASFAGAGAGATLSVGSNLIKRQIINVAPGRVSASSTDAVNGSQLHYAYTQADLANTAASEAKTKAEEASTLAKTPISLITKDANGADVQSDIRLGDRLTIEGAKIAYQNGQAVLTIESESGSTQVLGDDNILATKTDAGVQLALNKNINLGADGSLSVGQVVINDKGINAGGQVIAGVAKATADDHAVNYSQLTELKQTLQQEITQIDGAAGWNLVTGGVESAVAGKASTLEIAGKNISAKQSQLTDDQGNVTGTKLEVELDDNIELSEKGSLKIGNTVLDADGILVGQNQLTSQGLIVGQNKLTNQGLTVGKVLINNTGINAGGQVITGVAAGSKNDHAVNYGQLVALQGTVQGAIQNSGWTSTINGESATQVKNGDTFDISSGSNINVTSTADGVQIALNKDINLGADGSFAVGNVVIDGKGINAGGQVIAGVDKATQDDHAVNLGQMNERFDEFSQDMTSGINNAGWNIVGTDADGNQTTSKIKNDQSVSFEAGKNTIVSTELTATGAKVTVDLKDEITLDGEKGGLTVGAGKGKDAITIQQGNVNLGGNQVNNIAAGTSANDATTVDQLKGAINIFGGGATINADGGIVAPEYTIHGSTYKNVETALGALNQADIDLGDRIDNLGDRVNNLQQSFSNRLENVEDRMSAGIASAMALETAPYVAGKYTYSAATAYHNGQAAFGLTLRKTSDNGLWSLTGGVAAATEGDPSVRLGISGVIK